jgi:beta-N-acetylglucosaminidase
MWGSLPANCVSPNIEQTQLVKAISEIASAMPLALMRQLYQFARFLQGQPLSAEEVDEVTLGQAVLRNKR